MDSLLAHSTSIPRIKSLFFVEQCVDRMKSVCGSQPECLKLRKVTLQTTENVLGM